MVELFGEVEVPPPAPEGTEPGAVEDAYDFFFPEGHDEPSPATSATLARSRQLVFEMSDYAKDAVQMYLK